MKELTQELVRELFNYDPESGILTNKIARGNRKACDIVGSLNGNGYLYVGINKRVYRTHRVCFLHYHGYLPPSVDHKDTNKINNRILNLRECTSQQNNSNARIRKDNTSGIKGVSWYKRDKKWRTRININGKSKLLGYFTDVEDAKKAVESARIKHHKEFANNG